MDFLSFDRLLMMTPILLIALPIHEFAHAFVAWKLGDPTAKDAGRLTLNPFKHLDLLGALMMYAAGFGWAKPVPINSYYFKNRKTGTILVSIAGPLSNLILSFISMFLLGILIKLVQIEVIVIDNENMVTFINYVRDFFITLVTVNISLAIFNMIPIPPLDGSRLISSFIPEESYYRFARYEQYIGLVFIALVVFLPGNLFSRVIGFFAQPILNSFQSAVFFVLGL